MSVVVLGMDMPPVCVTEDGWYGNCPMDRVWCAMRFKPEYEEGQRIIDECTGKRPDWCPLRPLPEKHGRLADIDALEADGYKLSKIIKNPDSKNSEIVSIKALIPFDEAPTIIEAEGGVNDGAD